MGSPVPRPPGPEGTGVNGRHRPSQGMLVFSPGPLLPWNSAAPRLPWLQEGRFCVKSTHLKMHIYMFMAALGLRRCAQAFSSCGEQGSSPAAVRGLLVAVAASWRQAP